MIHLPITQDAFDNLLTGVVRFGRQVESLTDDELLVLAQMGETVAAHPHGSQIADQVDGWHRIMQSVLDEIEAR